MNKEEIKMSPKEVDAIIKTLRYLSLNKSISDKKGMELTGGFWSFVKETLKGYGAFSLDYGGIEVIKQKEFDYSLSKFEELSKEIEKADAENKIAVEANVSTTKSYRVSLAALILSVISILLSIYTLIYK